ncbi:hypothetical protein [Nodosilinea nodulosa]|uniref:hypothetical protein n=1 Tax=Nodosilinea nodulosa TaxID=416001 RepID=UPI0002E97643|nr:hypothetical protein [Nodosilinea nodulosa]
MSYLTRLSQQTGLAAAPVQAFPPIQSAESSQGMLAEVEEFTQAPEPRQLGEPTISPVSSPPAVNSQPLLPFAESQPPGQSVLGQESAVSESPGTRAAFRPEIAPPTEFSLSPPDPHPSRSEAIYIEAQPVEHQQTDSQGNSPSPLPEPAIAAIPQPSTVLPERAIPERIASRIAPSPPESAPNSPFPTYLQTLQAVRAWVSAPPEPLPEPEPPQTVQGKASGEIELAPVRQPQQQHPEAMDRATAPAPFPLTATEPTTVISIGSIEVTVEGPPTAPTAPPPPRSPRPTPRLSRHYLRLR